MSNRFGYPEWVGTKQDYINLMSMPEHRDRAINDLQAIYEVKDETANQVVSGSEDKGDLVTKSISAANPKWRQKGFTAREDVLKLIKQTGQK